VASSFGHFNKPLASIRGEEFYEKLKEYWLLRHGTKCAVTYRIRLGFASNSNVGHTVADVLLNSLMIVLSQ
jgi:hypothetical protein